MATNHKDRNCVGCGVTYCPTGPAQKLCAPCSADKQRERVRNDPEGATTIPEGSTPKWVEAHSPAKAGDDIV